MPSSIRYIALTVISGLMIRWIWSAAHQPSRPHQVASFTQTSTRNQVETITGRVVAVLDGDTVTVLDGSQQQHRIRLLAIDAPEKAQAFGQRSKQYLSGLVFGKNVTVEVRSRDRYGREVGRILLDGSDTNLEQVRAGLAWVYRDFTRELSERERQTYLAAEEAAKSSRLGLWSDPAPIPPWQWRKDRRNMGHPDGG